MFNGDSVDPTSWRLSYGHRSELRPQMNSLARVTAQPHERRWLEELTRELGACRLEGSSVARSFVDAARGRAMRDGALDRIRDAAEEQLATSSGKGYLVLDGFFSDPDAELRFTRAATILMALFGRPFHMVRRFAVWESLGVDLAKEPFRGGGVGYQPFHIDGVNTTIPPDFLVLLCRRHDPLGGGETILSNLQSAVAQLDTADQDYLQQPIFEEGEFYDLDGVGEDYRPFPVLTRRSDGTWQARVTGKMLPSMPSGKSKDVLERLLAILQKEQEVIPLRSGQAVIVNQLMIAHGRLALGPGQEGLPSSERRDLRQAFLRREGGGFLTSAPGPNRAAFT